jgi:hypothetical protein
MGEWVWPQFHNHPRDNKNTRKRKNIYYNHYDSMSLWAARYKACISPIHSESESSVAEHCAAACSSIWPGVPRQQQRPTSQHFSVSQQEPTDRPTNQLKRDNAAGVIAFIRREAAARRGCRNQIPEQSDIWTGGYLARERTIALSSAVFSQQAPDSVGLGFLHHAYKL